MKGVPYEKVTIRSEREIHSHFARRMFPWMAPLYPCLFAIHVITNPWLLEDIYLWATPFGVLFQYLAYMLILGHFLFLWYFSLNSVDHDENSLTLCREPNFWNRKTWILLIPFSEIARMRLNGDQYDVIRTDGSIVPLPKGERHIGSYNRIGGAIAAFLEAETEEEIPFQLPGSIPPPDPSIDYLKNAELRKTLEKQERSLQGLFSPGFFIVFLLILYGSVMAGDLIFNQNIDGENLSCFGILVVLLVIVIGFTRIRWDVVQQTKAALGPEQYDTFLRDHVILVSRPEEVVPNEPPGSPLATSFSHSGLFGPRSEKAPGGWKGLPLRINLTKKDSILGVIHAMLILPLLIISAALFFQIVRTIGFLLDETNGIGELLEEAFFSFCLGIAGFLLFLIILRISIGGYLYSDEVIRNNPIEQAIEERYWQRKREKQEREE